MKDPTNFIKKCPCNSLGSVFSTCQRSWPIIVKMAFCFKFSLQPYSRPKFNVTQFVGGRLSVGSYVGCQNVKVSTRMKKACSFTKELKVQEQYWLIHTEHLPCVRHCVNTLQATYFLIVTSTLLGSYHYNSHLREEMLLGLNGRVSFTVSISFSQMPCA